MEERNLDLEARFEDTRNKLSLKLPYFYGKMGVYVVIYRSKDKNTTQDNLAELVGSPVAPFRCK